jgi:hypothetical protein
MGIYASGRKSTLQEVGERVKVSAARSHVQTQFQKGETSLLGNCNIWKGTAWLWSETTNPSLSSFFPGEV